MKSYFIKPLVVLLSAVLLLMNSTAAFAAIDRLYVGPAGVTATTPADNLFRIAGGSRDFILLDATVTGDVYQYFVLAKNNYGARAFDPDNTAMFDVSDANNIAYWLNHDFVDPASTSSVKLEQDLVRHIDFAHQWLTEGGHPSTTYAQDYLTTAGVALLSQAEYVQYAGQFGYKDNMSSWGWWLRSPRGKNVGTNITLAVATGGTGETSGSEAKSASVMVRPAFYLQDSFFRSVKLDVATMGSKVKQALREHYSIEQLRAVGYSDLELGLMGYKVPEIIQVKMDQSSRTYSPDTVSFSVYFTNNKDMPVTYSVNYQTTDGTTGEQPVTVPASQTLLVPILLPPLKNGIHSLHVEVKEGQRLAAGFDSPTFAVFPDYEPRFGDDQALFGVAAHYDQSGKTDAQDTLLMDKAGIRYIRDGISWHKVEKAKGVFDFTRSDEWVNDAASKGMQIVSLLCFSNSLYNGGLDVKTGPFTQEQLDGYVNYVKQVVSHYKGKISAYELWNEPNISFWLPEPNVMDYARLVKAASLAIRSIDPEATIIAGSVATQNGPGYLDSMFLQEVYPYIDAVSFHPYVYPNNPDKNYETTLKSYTNITKKYGGWKDQNLTEIGWPTSTDARGVSEELQSVYLTKQYLISAANGIRQSAIYDFRNDGTDPTYTEDNFGIVRIDRMPKPALVAVRQINQALADAYYVGELNAGSQVKAYLWKKGQEYVIVAWSLSGGSQSIALTGGLVATDYLGNPLTPPGSGSTYAVGPAPVYFTGVDAAWAKEQVKTLAVSRHQKWLNGWDAVLSAAPALKSQLQGLYTAGFGSGTYTEIKAAAGQYEMLGKGIVDAAAAGSFTMENAMSMLYEYHLAGVPLEALMQGASGQPVLTALGSTAGLALTDSLIQAKLQAVSGGSLKFAQEIMRHARNWNQKAAAYLQAGKPDMALAWDETAGRLARWAADVAASETVEPTNLLLTSYPTKVSLFEGGSASILASVANQRITALVGAVKLIDPVNGATIAQEAVSLAPGEQKQLPFVIDSSALQAGQTSSLKLVLEGGNGVALRSQTIPVTLAPKVSLSLKPSGQTMEQLNSIGISLKNLFAGPLSGTVEVTPPPGWTMETAKAYNLAAGQSQDLAFSVEAVRNQPYHEYMFGVAVKDSEGRLLKSAVLPLSFAVMVKAEQTLGAPADFDGNLESWKKAYPIYLNPPAEPRSAQAWQESNLAARMYTQWDESALYVLAQVYDDYLFNNKSGMNIWDGDNVQVSVDPLHDKTSGKYSTDDYEYGFARTGQGNEVYAWQAATAFGQSYGSKPAEWVEVLRDEEQKLTTYMIRLPQANVTPLQLQEGTIFGFNTAVNDADILNRERLAEFTGGTASSKNPSLYADWRLSGAEPDFPEPVVYSIAIGTFSGGSITASTASAQEGDTVTLTVVPDPGKRLVVGSLMLHDGVTATPVSGTSFTMPAANVTVSAAFEELPPEPADPAAVLAVTAPTFASVTEGYAQPAAAALAIANSGSADAAIVSVASSDPGAFLVGGEGTTVAAGGNIASWTVRPAAGLAAGTHHSVITVTYGTNGSDAALATATANISLTVRAASPGSGPDPDPDSAPVQPSVPSAGQSGDTFEAVVTLNGKPEALGSTKSVTENNRTNTIFTPDKAKIAGKLESGASGQVISVKVPAGASAITGSFTGDLVKLMADQSAVLELASADASYRIDTALLPISEAARQLGAQDALDQVEVRIQVSPPDAAAIQAARQTAAAEGLKLLAEPVVFTITASYGGKSMDIAQFAGYVKRTLALTGQAGAGQYTAGVVILADGSFYPVPSYLMQTETGPRLVIHSLTNSSYAAVSSSRSFTDASDHWASADISKMSTRMIVDGASEHTFEPDRSITRAEFAAIMLRALGLAPKAGAAPYADVPEDAWYADYVNTAIRYGLVNGLTETRFAPLETISRQEAMTIAARAMKLTGLAPMLSESRVQEILAPYADGAAIAPFAREGAAACLQAGVAEGRTATLLAPEGTLTRAEAAILAYRVLKQSNLAD